LRQGIANEKRTPDRAGTATIVSLKGGDSRFEQITGRTLPLQKGTIGAPQGRNGPSAILAISLVSNGWKQAGRRFFGLASPPAEHGREQDRYFSRSRKTGTWTNSKVKLNS
jgi:hypothetical protein